MRRTVMMLLVAAMAAAVAPLSATAAGSGDEAAPLGAVAAKLQAGVEASARSFELGGRPCSLIPVPTAGESTPVGVSRCPGVRPGARVESKAGFCTLNFLFRSPEGQRYMGTAGHCILGMTEPPPGQNSELTWAPGTGPEARDGDGARIGEFVYAVLEDPKDFALIRLDPGVEASPEMCHFGGPTGLNADETPDIVELEYYGLGVGVGTVLPARSAVAAGLPDPDHVYAFGAALPGDSGSGVISSDGRAVGVLVSVGVHGLGIYEDGIDFGTIGITRLGPQLTRAQEKLGASIELVTAG
jgi:hypothetical protein